jgi:TonB-dependent starch-binding outer membrane protein SusC
MSLKANDLLRLSVSYFFIFSKYFKTKPMSSKRCMIAGPLTALFLFLFIFSTSIQLWAQDVKQVSGTIRDETSEALLSGVSVQVKGSALGASTDKTGKYIIKAKPGDVLVISMVGYKPRELTVDNRSLYNLTLEENSVQMQNVVVNVGYGTLKKANLTGAVSTVTAKNLKERPVANFGAAMVGQVAGVQIQQVSGDPGDEGLSVRIRGASSITQSNDPLYVVDGYPMEGNAFKLINPSDIESIDVLKDASSTAIYGSRGANGVIIINTKKGRGAPLISFSAYTGVQQLAKKIKMMNRDQYVQYFIDARNQAWLDAASISADPNSAPHTINDPNSRRKLYPGATSQYLIPDGTGSYKYNFLDPASVATMPDNDWQDLLFRTAATRKSELSISGGTDKSNYLISGSYLQQKGIVLNSDYNRFNFHSNISTKITDQIEVGGAMNAFSGQGNVMASSGVGNRYSPISYAINLPPIFPLMNDDGTYGSMVRNPEILSGEHVNPIAQAIQPYNFAKTNGWFGMLFGTWNIINGLQYKISVNGSTQTNIGNSFLPSYVDQVGSLAPRPNSGSYQNAVDQDWLVEQTVNYSKTFAGKHYLNALVGYTTQKHNNEVISGAAKSFPTDNIYTLNAGLPSTLSQTQSAYSMISYLARVNYTFNNRYLLTATIRRDGSSRFGRDNKWGNFPSVSAGWRISQENFFQNIPIVSELKIRGSFGVAGNNRIGDYSSIGLLSTGLYPTGNTLQLTVQPNTLSNYDLGWEKSQQLNVGLDLNLLNNRIRFTADAYKTKSIDLLLDAPVPSITGFISLTQNVGNVENRGVEFQVSTDNFIRAFTWSTDFNISFNQNKVLQIAGDRVLYAGVSGSGNTFITQRGYPIASFYGYVYEGVFQNQAELSKYPHLATDKVGDGRYRDVNGDGKIDDNDKTIIGNNQPHFTGGFSNNFSYKNFTMGIQFVGSYGAKLYSFFERMVGTYNGDRNGMVTQLTRWRSEQDPGDGIHFRPTATPIGLQLTPSSAWVTDGSYLRLQDVTIGYNFPDKLFNRIKLKGLRLYVTGQNIFTWTKYPGLDPATSSAGTGLAKGGDFSGYPLARSLMAGVNVKL